MRLNPTVKVIVDFARDLAGLASWGPEPEYRCEILLDEAEITRGRRFQTELYSSLGKIDPAAIGPDGLLTEDGYHDISTYFATYRGEPGPDGRGGEMVAFGRLLWRPDTTAHDLKAGPELVGGRWAETLDALGPGLVAEEGALAKKPGVPRYAVQKVHQTIVAFAEAHGVRYTVATLEPKVYPFYRALFGDGMRRMHPGTVLPPGIDTPHIPVVVDHTYRVRALQELRAGANPALVAVRAAGIAYGLRVLVPALTDVEYRHELTGSGRESTVVG